MVVRHEDWFRVLGIAEVLDVLVLDNTYIVPTRRWTVPGGAEFEPSAEESKGKGMIAQSHQNLRETECGVFEWVGCAPIRLALSPN